MIPEHTRGSLERYIKYGIPPGGFLTAVLSNDLFGAVGRADQENLVALHEIVEFIYRELPGGAWGSSQHVSDWLRSDSWLPVANKSDT